MNASNDVASVSGKISVRKNAKLKQGNAAPTPVIPGPGVVPYGSFYRKDSDINFASLGDEFLNAAKVLSEHDKMPTSPTYFLAFQALELYLKAYLRRKGASLKDIKAKIGHSIQRAIEEARRQGLVLNTHPEREKTINQMSGTYERRDLQYCSIGSWTLILPKDLISFVDKVRCASGY
jgi:HEPN domain-containing protein